MVSPPMPGSICIWQICDGSNKVSLHCISHENAVQAWHDVKADAQSNPYIEDTRKDIILPYCKIPVPPWELIPHCSQALP